jgi:hypothetical protein
MLYLAHSFVPSVRMGDIGFLADRVEAQVVGAKAVLVG